MRCSVVGKRGKLEIDLVIMGCGVIGAEPQGLRLNIKNGKKRNRKQGEEIPLQIKEESKMLNLFKKKNYFQLGVVLPKKIMNSGYGHSYLYLESHNMAFEEGTPLEVAKVKYTENKADLLNKIQSHNDVNIEDILQVITRENLQIHTYYKKWVKVIEKNGMLKTEYPKELLRRSKTLGMKFPDVRLINLDREWEK